MKHTTFSYKTYNVRLGNIQRLVMKHTTFSYETYNVQLGNIQRSVRKHTTYQRSYSSHKVNLVFQPLVEDL